jgi:hypothetical protein
VAVLARGVAVPSTIWRSALTRAVVGSLFARPFAAARSSSRSRSSCRCGARHPFPAWDRSAGAAEIAPGFRQICEAISRDSPVSRFRTFSARCPTIARRAHRSWGGPSAFAGYGGLAEAQRRRSGPPKRGRKLRATSRRTGPGLWPARLSNAAAILLC